MSEEIKIRKKNKKRRRAKNYYDEEYEDFVNCKRHKEELLPKWKLYAVCGAIFMCFALLYPSVFSPMINSFFGRNNVNEQHSRPLHKDPRFSHPEGFRGGRPPHSHPAAAASMHAHAKAHQNQAVGGGRGGFAWLLPFYTIGVVLFLLYTFFKKKKKPKRREILDFEDSDEEEEESSSNSSNEYAPSRRYKLRSVQERLRKTEEAMQDILSQLELIALNKETLNEGEDKFNENLKETQNMAKSLEKLKKLSAIYKKNERLRDSFGEKIEDSQEEEEEEEEEDFEEKEKKEETSSSFEEEEMSELEEIEENNEGKEENREENVKIRKRRKV
ncbi:RIC3 domain-containing protein [Meloidogyne graminicola]|uniref:RIC3 domain-containing protein n=1 Tax=Meloidogyne graminicola TaxID=189291 RepID=A0A8T0A1A9_9BILA|nr:RIC3 domain-containing protein [Meloidogyne graminicola]